MAQHVLERLCHTADTAPDRPAFRELVAGGRATRVLTYAQLARASGALAERLRRQWPERPVAMVSYGNRLEFAVAFFGVLGAGGVVFPIHPRLTDEERRTAARQSGAVAILGSDEACAAVAPLGVKEVSCADMVDEASPAFRSAGLDPARGAAARLYLQSSGTTGAPKIVDRDGPALDAVARNVCDGARLRPEDRVLGVVPAGHSYGVESVMLGPVWAGATILLCQGVDAVLGTQQQDVRPTVIPGVPSLFELFAAAESPLSGPELRLAYSAGANLPRRVYDTCVQRFGVRIGQLYGMTEIGSATFNDPAAPDHDPGGVGAPMGGVKVRIVSPDAGGEGEVAVWAPSMLTRYLPVPGAAQEHPTFLPDGYFPTGDLGRIDADGRLTITGRLKLIVDVGGLKVNLLEVEEALRGYPAVADCAVVAVPVSDTVCRLKAYVVPAAGEGHVPFDEVRAYLRARLSAHKVPRAFELRDALPRSATGKVLRHKLLEGDARAAE